MKRLNLIIVLTVFSITICACQEGAHEKVIFELEKAYPKSESDVKSDIRKLAWSQDGKKLAFLVDRFKPFKTENGWGEIWTVDIYTGYSSRVFKRNYGDVLSYEISDLLWHPNGKLMFVGSKGLHHVSDTPIEGGIWTINSDGSALTPVIVSAGTAYGYSSVSCNSDGRIIAFTRFHQNTAVWQLCISDIERRVIKLLQTSEAFNSLNTKDIASFGGICWSPDNRLILFEVIYTREDFTEYSRIWRINQDGTNLKGAEKGSYAFWTHGNSPDGHRIAFIKKDRIVLRYLP